MKINLTEAYRQVKKYFPEAKSITVEASIRSYGGYGDKEAEPTFQWGIHAGDFYANSTDFPVALAEVVAQSRVKEATTDVVVDSEAPTSEPKATPSEDSGTVPGLDLP